MRASILLEKKLNVIEDAEWTTTADNGQLVRLYNNHQLKKNHGIKRTSVIDILKSKEKIWKAVEDGYGPNRKRLKKAVKSPDLVERLLNWFRQVRSRKTPVSGELF